VTLGGLVGIVIATGASIVLAGVMGVPFLFDPAINLLSFVFSAGIHVGGSGLEISYLTGIVQQWQDHWNLMGVRVHDPQGIQKRLSKFLPKIHCALLS